MTSRTLILVFLHVFIILAEPNLVFSASSTSSGDLQRDQQGPALGSSPRVYLDYGDFTGARADGIDSFKGIPYADSPTGALRFRNPRPVSRNFTNFDATRPGPACPQQNAFAGAVGPSLLKQTVVKLMTDGVTSEYKGQGIGQEDCLTLDVHRPAHFADNANARLPVVIFIHGGSYVYGSSVMFPIQNLVARSIAIAMPVIYVSVNYRLGAFGFLGGRQMLRADGANLGLKDQRLAMQWVQKYIAKFGGDPQKVIISGHSAGAMAVSHHLYAFGGKPSNLFRGAICQSGTVIPTHRGAGQKTFDTITKHVGCYSDPDPVSCLRKVDFEKLLAAENMLPGVLARDAFPPPFMPFVDGGIVPSIITNHKKFATVPIISGTVDDEGTVVGVGPGSVIKTRSQIKEYINGVYPRASDALLEKLLDYYQQPNFTDSLTSKEPSWAFKELSLLIGDLGFQARRRGFLREAQNVSPAWGYNDAGLKDTPLLGAFHGSELGSVFAPPSDNSTRAKEFQTRWIAFAHNLDPNVPGLPIWKPYGPEAGEILLFNKTGSAGMICDKYREAQIDLIISRPWSFSF